MKPNKQITLFAVLVSMGACSEDREKYRGVSLTKAWHNLVDEEDDLHWLLSTLSPFFTDKMNLMIRNAYNQGLTKCTIPRDEFEEYCTDEEVCTKAMLATISLRTVQKAVAAYVNRRGLGNK